jgi:hypothetical protein
MGVLLMLGLNPFSALTSKVFGGLLILSLVTLGPALWITRGKLADARETIDALLTWQTEMVDAVRIASNNPEVDSTTAKAQVQELGIIRIELKNAIENQNAALDEMERQSAEATRIAMEAERRRRAANARAEELARRLEARARVPAPADQMERAVREAQDAAFKEGL